MTVFDKGRGLGGRLATRRIEGGSFDHGASALQTETEAFEAFLHASGAAAVWPDRAGTWVGVPTMNAPLKPLTEGLDIRFSTRVGAMWQTESWTLTDESDASLGRFDRVISTVPAPQARQLVGGDAALCAALDGVQMAPQWAGLFGWQDAPGDDFTQMHPGGALDLIARMATKPGRTGPMDCWVVHASADWTRTNLDVDRTAIPAMLLAEVEAMLGRLPQPDHATAHRWLYSRTETPLANPTCPARTARCCWAATGRWARMQNTPS